MIRLCRILGYVWLAATVLLMVACFGLIWRVEGLSAAQEAFRLSNPANPIVTVLIASPGIGLLLLAHFLQGRARRKMQKETL